MKVVKSIPKKELVQETHVVLAVVPYPVKLLLRV